MSEDYYSKEAVQKRIIKMFQPPKVATLTGLRQAAKRRKPLTNLRKRRGIGSTIT